MTVKDNLNKLIEPGSVNKELGAATLRSSIAARVGSAVLVTGLEADGNNGIKSPLTMQVTAAVDQQYTSGSVTITIKQATKFNLIDANGVVYKVDSIVWLV